MWRWLQMTGMDWQALGVVVTFLVGIGGWIYAYLALRSARQDRIEAIRPLVVFKSTESKDGRSAFWLKNVGHGVALNIDYEAYEVIEEGVIGEQPFRSGGGRDYCLGVQEVLRWLRYFMAQLGQHTKKSGRAISIFQVLQYVLVGSSRNSIASK